MDRRFRHFSPRVRAGNASECRHHCRVLSPDATDQRLLKTLRAVLRWGGAGTPTPTVELSGLFELPSQSKGQLAYAADAYGLERIIEAVLGRPARDELLPLRDAAHVSAMGFTVAARPSEWLYSASWGDLHDRSVELQRPGGGVGENRIGSHPVGTDSLSEFVPTHRFSRPTPFLSLPFFGFRRGFPAMPRAGFEPAAYSLGGDLEAILEAALNR